MDDDPILLSETGEGTGSVLPEQRPSTRLTGNQCALLEIDLLQRMITDVALL